MFETTDHQKILLVEIMLEKIDMTVSAEFQRGFYEIIKARQGVILLDMEKVTFMDSTGLAALVFSFRSRDVDKKLAVCCLQERVKYLFNLAKMSEHIQIFGTRAEAMSALSEQQPG